MTTAEKKEPEEDCTKYFVSDFKYKGGGISDVTGITTPALCQKECQKVSTCKLWQHIEDTDTCRLKTESIEKAVPNKPGNTVGSRYCTPAADCFLQDTRYFHAAGIDKVTGVPSAYECQLHCQELSNCLAWQYDDTEGKGTCKRKSEIEDNPDTKVGFVAGPRFCSGGTERDINGRDMSGCGVDSDKLEWSDGSACYHFGRSKMNHNSSRNYCDNMMDMEELAYISSPQEKDTVAAWLTSNGVTDAWIGGHIGSGNFNSFWGMQIDDMTSYDNWCENNPVTASIDTCVNLIEEENDICWSNTDCRKYKYPICKKLLPINYDR